MTLRQGCRLSQVGTRAERMYIPFVPQHASRATATEGILPPHMHAILKHRPVSTVASANVANLILCVLAPRQPYAYPLARRHQHGR